MDIVPGQFGFHFVFPFFHPQQIKKQNTAETKKYDAIRRVFKK